MKTLYVVVVNGGDGSSYPRYTFNTEWINKMKTAYYNDDPEFDYESYADGDGFHYDELTVPDECTLESLGIHFDAAGNND